MLEEQMRAALTEYQQLNTRYFDLVRPSLEIYNDRRHWEEDHNTIECYSVITPGGKIISDGNGLVAWARSFTDVSSIENQGDIRLRLASAKLSKTATVSQIDDHIHSLWCDWNLLHENKPQYLKPYWSTLLFSIPTEPEQSLLTQVRNRLANAIADQAPVLADYPASRNMLISYAHTIGIKDDAASLDSVNALGGTTPGANNGGGRGGGREGEKKRDSWASNDCERCPLKACQANQRKPSFPFSGFCN
jgi:hypothetical protein